MKLPIFALLIVTLVFMSGCSSLSRNALQSGTSWYCENLSSIEREAVRARVQAATFPHTVTVECADLDSGADR